MISIFLFLFFLGTAVIFGGSICRYILNERRIFAFIPLTILIGINGYNFFVNLISYIIPVQSAMWAVFILMLFVSGVIYSLRDKTESNVLVNPLAPKQLRILLIIAILISTVSGIFALRSLAVDDEGLGHLPLAATISEGNFPVKNPSSPSHPMNYHYGSDLLTASLYNVARLPPWLGYDIQTIIFSGLIFLMAFLLAFEIIGRFRSALLAAFLTLYGGGLIWLNFVHGISPLWRKFILHEQVVGPWAFIWGMIYAKISSSLVYGMLSHSTAMAFPVMLAMIYCYLKIFSKEEKRPAVYAIMAGLLLGYLALSMETSFVIVLIAMTIFFMAKMVFLLCRLFRERGDTPANLSSKCKADGVKKIGGYFLIVVAVGILLALFQGGILSVLGNGTSVSSFAFNWRFWVMDFGYGRWNIFGRVFLMELGFLLFLFLPAIWFYRRDKKIIFLALIAGGAFLTPLFVRYIPLPWDTARFFGLYKPLAFFVVGLFLGDLSLKLGHKYKYQAFIIFIIFLTVFSSLLFQLTTALTPFEAFGQFRAPFFRIPPPPPEIDKPAYDWIKKNTSIKESFYPYNENFIRENGRFTPGFNADQPAVAVFPEEIMLYKEFTSLCSREAAKKLKIDYLYIGPDFPIKDFYVKCLPNLPGRTVFRTQIGNDFREIYKLD